MVSKLKYYAVFMREILRLIIFQTRAKTVFFFPFYHTGGGERVHADIVKAMDRKKSLVIFTNPSHNNHFYEDFQKHAYTIDISRFLKNKHFNNCLTKIFIKISQRKKITFFGCNSAFFYSLLPKLNKDTYKVDLLHAFSNSDYGMEIISLPYLEYLNKRIVINQRTKNDYTKLYEQKNIDKKFTERIEVISNATSIPPFPKKHQSEKLNIIFVGRIAPEKRVNLIVEIGKKVEEFASTKIYGPKELEISDIESFYGGNITDLNLLEEIYEKADVLVITSEREGFPMVIMEAMARGVVCISTNVGGIAEHISNAENGFLVENSDSEQIIADFYDVINSLNQNRSLLKEISRHSYQYAKKKFDFDMFNKEYRKILMR